MKYLVSMELMGTPPTSPQQLDQHIEQRVLPFHETLVKLEVEKKILAGGDVVGERATVFIVEAESNEELDNLLMGLPLWPLMKVDVSPLVSFEDRLAKERQFREHLKAAAQ